MAAEKGFISEQTPGSVEEKALNPGTFPTEAWEFTEPGNADPTLTLKEAWTMEIAGDLNVVGGLDVDGDTTVDGTLTATDGHITNDLTVDGDAEITGTLTVGSEPVRTWHKVDDPTAGTFASKTSGWTADRFTSASGGFELDFSAVVPVGTKAVIVTIRHVSDNASIYTRPAGDDTYSANTPIASSEDFTRLFYAPSSGAAHIGEYILQLNNSRVAEIATASTSSDVYVSYPKMELR